jgi:hypothetical protein
MTMQSTYLLCFEWNIKSTLCSVKHHAIKIYGGDGGTAQHIFNFHY